MWTRCRDSTPDNSRLEARGSTLDTRQLNTQPSCKRGTQAKLLATGADRTMQTLARMMQKPREQQGHQRNFFLKKNSRTYLDSSSSTLAAWRLKDGRTVDVSDSAFEMRAMITTPESKAADVNVGIKRGPKPGTLESPEGRRDSPIRRPSLLGTGVGGKARLNTK